LKKIEWFAINSGEQARIAEQLKHDFEKNL
jgi:hypothetical protein